MYFTTVCKLQGYHTPKQIPDLVYKIRNCGKCSDPLLILTTYPIVIYTKAAVELGLDETFMMNDFPSLAIDFIPGIDKYRIDTFIFFLKTLNISDLAIV